MSQVPKRVCLYVFGSSACMYVCMSESPYRVCMYVCMYVCLSPPKHACISETSKHVCMSEVTILILLSGALTRGSYINTTFWCVDPR